MPSSQAAGGDRRCRLVVVFGRCLIDDGNGHARRWGLDGTVTGDVDCRWLRKGAASPRERPRSTFQKKTSSQFAAFFLPVGSKRRLHRRSHRRDCSNYWDVLSRASVWTRSPRPVRAWLNRSGAPACSRWKHSDHVRKCLGKTTRCCGAACSCLWTVVISMRSLHAGGQSTGGSGSQSDGSAGRRIGSLLDVSRWHDRH